MNHRPAVQKPLPTLLALLALLPAPSGAATYVSNFSEPYQVGLSACPPPAPSTACSFTTDAANYVLSSLTLKFHSNAPDIPVNLRIRFDFAGRPSSYLLEDLGSVIVPAGESEQTFVSAGLALAAHTTYWVCAGELGTDCYTTWKATFSTAETSIAGWTIGDYAVFSRDTLGWDPGSSPGSGLMRIDAVPAAAYVSNLTEANELAFAASPPPNAFSASSFTTDAQDYVLTNLTLQLQSAEAGGSVGVRLRADDGGKPGGLVENLGIRVLPVGESAQTFASAGVVLAANTTYWITAGEVGTGSVTWRATSSPGQTSRGAWTVGDESFESVDGAAWTPIALGPSTEAGLFSIDANRVAAIGNPFARADGLELSAPFPNPSRGSTRIEYALPTAGHVRLTLHDTRGRLVATLRDGDAPAGRQSSAWNASASAGVYFVRLEVKGIAGTAVKARAIVLTN
jgi:hypothetical protein